LVNKNNFTRISLALCLLSGFLPIAK